MSNLKTLNTSNSFNLTGGWFSLFPKSEQTTNPLFIVSDYGRTPIPYSPDIISHGQISSPQTQSLDDAIYKLTYNCAFADRNVPQDCVAVNSLCHHYPRTSACNSTVAKLVINSLN